MAKPVVAGDGEQRQALRLGYFPNVTHAAAFAGLERGLFAKHLEPYGGLKGVVFSAGPAAVEALFSNAVDAAYIGPNPAINAFQRSEGRAVRLVAGAASGGTALVVAPGINAPADLRGKTIATPQLGNTQDVALRHWLRTQRFTTAAAGGGNVKVVTEENAQTLDLFKQRKIHGAWVPEPWVSRLVIEAGGKVLLNESDVWDGGRYLTAGLIARKDVLERNPQAVRALLAAHLEATSWLNDEPEAAKQLVNTAIAKITGKTLPADVMTRAWENVTFIYEPLTKTLEKQAANAVDVGLLDRVDLKGLFDPRLLNEVLESSGKPKVTA